MKKQFLWIGTIFLFLFLFGIFFVTYNALSQPPKTEILSPPQIMTDNPIYLGTSMNLSCEVQSSWHYQPYPQCEVILPEGIQLLSSPVYQIQSVGYNQWTTRITVPIQAFRTGELKGGKMSLQVNGFSKTTPVKTFSIDLPVVNVQEIKLNNIEPTLADPLYPDDPQNNLFLFWVIGLFLLVLLGGTIGFFYFRKKSKKIILLPPWDLAQQSLQRLKQTVQNKEITAEFAVAELTDIVRGYLEVRFGIPASRCTTDEFLTLLSKPQSPLNDLQKKFLKDFLLDSEKIKFAGALTVDENVFLAIQQASRLISETQIKERPNE